MLLKFEIPELRWIWNFKFIRIQILSSIIHIVKHCKIVKFYHENSLSSHPTPCYELFLCYFSNVKTKKQFSIELSFQSFPSFTSRLRFHRCSLNFSFEHQTNRNMWENWDVDCYEKFNRQQSKFDDISYWFWRLNDGKFHLQFYNFPHFYSKLNLNSIHLILMTFDIILLLSNWKHCGFRGSH